MTVKEVVSLSKVTGCINRCRQSRNLVLVIVFIALFLDNMLLSVVGQYCNQYTHRHTGVDIAPFFVLCTLSGCPILIFFYTSDCLSNGSFLNHWNKKKKKILLYRFKNIRSYILTYLCKHSLSRPKTINWEKIFQIFLDSVPMVHNSWI